MLLICCSLSNLVEGVSSAENGEIYTGVEAYSALKKKKKAGQVVYSMVLPVVNIKSWGVGGGVVGRCRLLLFKTPWVELSVRQADTSCSFLKHSQSDCNMSKKGIQGLSINKQTGYLQQGWPYRQPGCDLEKWAD